MTEEQVRAIFREELKKELDRRDSEKADKFDKELKKTLCKLMIESAKGIEFLPVPQDQPSKP